MESLLVEASEESSEPAPQLFFRLCVVIVPLGDMAAKCDLVNTLQGANVGFPLLELNPCAVSYGLSG